MKVLELLEEIDEIINVATPVPLMRKVMVDPNEIIEIVEEIRMELPDEIQQAQWIKTERTRILEDAKAEYEALLTEAKNKAEQLVETDQITVGAKARAEETLRLADESATITKLGVLDYTDTTLYSLQEKVDQMYATYFTQMYEDLQNVFEQINQNIAHSRNNIKNEIYKAQRQMEKERE